MLNPAQESPVSLKSTDSELIRMKRRLKKLQDQNKNHKQSADRHKSLTNDILLKKIAMAQSLAQAEKEKVFHKLYQQEYAEKEAKRIEQLKQINSYKRAKHTQQLNNIMKAVYMVKMDDARELRRISNQHKNKIQELNGSLVQLNQQRREKIKSEGGKKQQQYWKQKLYKLYLENNMERLNSEKSRKLKEEELENLQNQEAKLMKIIEKNKGMEDQSKKQYFTAVSLPIREVAGVLQKEKEELGSNQIYNEYKGDEREPSMQNSMSERISRVKIKKENGLLFNSSKKVEYREKSNIFKNPQDNYFSQELGEDEVHFPKTQVNQTKLKIVLEKLRKKKKK